MTFWLNRGTSGFGWMRSIARIVCVLGVACGAVGCRSNNQQTFASPEEAATALTEALRPYDAEKVKAILGPEGHDIVHSGDDVADESRIEIFLDAFDAGHEVVMWDDGSATLVVGESEWPFPIPLVERGSAWRFDTESGKEEILSRRIGRNELSTIETCRAVADAQREYAGLDPNGDGRGDYAMKFLSDPGSRDGLYWQTAPGEPESPLGPLVGAAQAEGYNTAEGTSETPRPYHGYCYRMLTAQGPFAPGGVQNYLVNGRLTGGFAVVAYPAAYGNSGIMTFLVSDDGIVYQRDLGTSTENIARGMSVFDPDADWSIVY